MRALLVALSILSAAAPAAAQVRSAPQAFDGGGPREEYDQEWEERRDPYDGSPLRPGSQLDYSTSPLVPIGAALLGAGFVISVIGATQGRPEAAIPLAGPWLAALDAFNSAAAWDDLAAVAMGVAGVAQAIGLALLVIGVAIPNRYVIYDAPVGSPSPYAVGIGLDAGPGGVGLSLRVEAL